MLSRHSSRIALPLLMSLAATCAHAAPDGRLLAAATAEQNAVVDTLKAMVAIESGSGDSAGLARMAALVDDRLKALGFRTERRKSPVGVGADTVVATLSGTGTKRFMLQGHMDTVYGVDHPFQSLAWREPGVMRRPLRCLAAARSCQDS